VLLFFWSASSNFIIFFPPSPARYIVWCMQGPLESKDVRLTVSIYPEIPKWDPQVTPKETAQGRYIFGGFGECSWKIFRGLPLTTTQASLLDPVSPAITPATPPQERHTAPPPSSTPPRVPSLALPASQVTSQIIPSPQITPQPIAQPNPSAQAPNSTSSVQTV
jgi:hypothetical protein